MISTLKKQMALLCLLAMSLCNASRAQTTLQDAGRWMQDGQAYAGRLDYTAAIGCYSRAADLCYRWGALAEYAMATTKKSECEYILGQWNEARQGLDSALYAARQAGNDDLLVFVLTGEATLCRNTGDTDGYNRALTRLDSVANGSPSPGVTWRYHLYWCDDLVGRHDYAAAEYHLRQCGDVVDRLPVADRYSARMTYLQKMGEMMFWQKNYKQAIGYARQLVSHCKSHLGGDAFANLSYASLMMYYACDGDRASMLSAADSMRLAVQSHGSAALADVLCNLSLGCAYWYLYDYESAMHCFDKADKVLAGRDAATDAMKYQALFCRLRTSILMRNYPKARALNEELVCVIQRKNGTEAKERLAALTELMVLCAKDGDTAAADSIMTQLPQEQVPVFRDYWKTLSTAQRAGWFPDGMKGLSRFTETAVIGGHRQNAITTIGYNALLLQKALLLDTDRSVRDIVRRKGTPENAEQLEQLLALQTHKAALEKDARANIREIDSLRHAAQAIDQQLTSLCGAYAEYSDFLGTDFAKIKAGLKEGETLVDFACYDTDIPLDTPQHANDRQYAAYVVRSGQPAPLLLPLLRESQIDSLSHGRQPEDLYEESIGGELRNRLWQPLADELKEGEVVYYVPAGRLHAVALESLPWGDGTVLGDHYHFVRLTSAREVERLRKGNRKPRTAVLYGGLDYDVEASAMALESAKAKLSWSPAAMLYRGSATDEGFAPIAHSREEVSAIAQTLDGAGCESRLLTGSHGTEETVVGMSGHAPDILHFATHAFCYTPGEAQATTTLDGYRDAMSLCGLVLSGGNAGWTGKPLPHGVMDGVLPARDIAALDLSNATMVALSACRTAQGRVTADGIYGLQRAFKEAGAGTIVMSLWKVSDTVTAEFMEEFYRQLQENGWNKRTAFDKTRAAIRRRYPEPFYWAAFVMLD